MDLKIKQDDRAATLKTALADDLAVARFDCEEGLARLYELRIEAVSEKAVDLDKVIGLDACVEIRSASGGKRYISGIVVEADIYGRSQKQYSYGLIVRPWLWLLGQKTDSRIFASETPVDIIKKVLKEHGGAIVDKISDGYPKLEYCVQYRESDLAFVSRLMEEFGIYYYFEHKQNEHKMVLLDSRSAHSPAPNLAEVKYLSAGTSNAVDREFLNHWAGARRLTIGKVALNSYNHMKPNAVLLSESEKKRGHAKGDIEFYDYPHRFIERPDGEKLAKVVLEAEQARDEHRHGAGQAVSLFPGALVELKGHPEAAENTKYLVLGCSHRYVNNHYRSGSSAEIAYSGHYEFLPATIQYRSPKTTPRPVIAGAQTARVVSKGGDEIDVDDQGRITVQFFWDRNKDLSRRVRVAQVWAGKSWGGIVIPRTGQEVVVEFLEGDPDQPVVVGALYNGDNKAPFSMPGQKNISGWKSNSTPGGGGFNEVSLDDSKGKELINIHAQKDEAIVVENDKTESVGHDETIQIKNNRTETVSGNETLTVVQNRTRAVQGNETVTVSRLRTHTVGINEAITVGAAQEVTVGGIRALSVGLSQTTTIGISHTETVGGSHTETIGGSHTETIAKGHSEKVGGDHSSTVIGGHKESVGKDRATSIGKNLVVTAGESIVLKTGQASISMKKDGTITIQGKNITIKGSGPITIKSDKNVVLKGQKILEN